MNVRKTRPAMHIGIDLGGTKIEGLLLDAQGVERGRERAPTPRGQGYEPIVEAVREVVARLERGAAVRATVGVGTPGSLSPATSLLRNCNATELNGRPFRTDLEVALSRPVRMANDANCFALSEAQDGAGAGAEIVFGVIVGTGVGGGVVVRGRALSGRNGIAGEWGHNPLPWSGAEEHPGRECWCGRLGCLETFLGGPALRADHARATGEWVEPSEIARRAEAGDEGAQATLERYADRLARGLASVMNLLDPDVIVLGGGLSNIAFLYRRVPELWGRYAVAGEVRTRLVAPVHGDSSGVRGAAWLGRGDVDGSS